MPRKVTVYGINQCFGCPFFVLSMPLNFCRKIGLDEGIVRDPYEILKDCPLEEQTKCAECQRKLDNHTSYCKSCLSTGVF